MTGRAGASHVIRDWAPLAQRDLARVAPQARAEALHDAAADLAGRWAEPHRAYHDPQHLQEVLRALDELAQAGEVDDEHLAVARVAAWYHDAIYDVHAAPEVTERASAELARVHLGRLGVAEPVVAAVETIVLDTAHPELAPHTPAGRAMHDADLWILAAPPQRFDDYCAAVRREYAHVAQADYRQARSTILQGIAARDPLYLTAAGAAWEPAARSNLSRELARLA